ncbi:MAG: hypothetical protein HY860_01525 [Chlamydiales bacterium]|nr:hypothetical protein [Chlamydiales bacterium]
MERKLIMKEYKKYFLEFDSAYNYFVNYLNDGNSLAKQLRNKIAFEKGSFFALTSLQADLTKINEFKIGEILPANPIIEKKVLGENYQARVQSTSFNELAAFIQQQISKNPTLFCIFEDVIRIHLPTEKELEAELKREIKEIEGLTIKGLKR